MPKRLVSIFASVALGAAVLAVGASAAGAASPRIALPGSTPPWATRTRRSSTADASQKLQFRVYLTPRDQAGAEAEAQAVSDPASRSYGHYLSPAAATAAFGPTQASVDAVRSWLSGAGFAIGDVPDNRQYVEAVGTVAQVQSAFATTLGVYSYRGHHLRAPDTGLSVPSSIAGAITGVVGVDQGQALLRPDHIAPERAVPATGAANKASAKAKASSATDTVDPPDGFRNAQPCSAWFGQKVDTTDPTYSHYAHPSYAPCGYTPPQLRAAYGIDGAVGHGIDGRGTTVAIIDAFAAPTIFQDAATYAKKNDPGHPLRANQFRQVLFPTNSELEGPDECDAAGWYGEETLDVEAVHATAPGANIVYVGGSDCNDQSLDKALNLVVSKHLAQIVSNSYGDAGEDIDPAEVKAFQQISVQAVLEGIGVYFSSGDDGDEVLDLGGPPQADFSASSPWVTAVGGTSLGIGRNGQKTFETGWETFKTTLDPDTSTWDPNPAAYVYGSGGGTSVLFSEPFYQRRVVPTALARHNQTGRNLGRVVPDISMLGDPSTGMLVGETQTFPDGVYYDQYRIGGTSLASPLFAGVMADSDSIHRFPAGFINPRLYGLAGSRAINDVRHVDTGVIRSDYANGIDDSDGLVTSFRGFDYQGLTIATRPGYDDVTGLGTPNGLNFLLSI